MTEARGDAPRMGPTDTESVPLCDVCGGPTYERHCKVICSRCGYTLDCSDL